MLGTSGRAGISAFGLNVNPKSAQQRPRYILKNAPSAPMQRLRRDHKNHLNMTPWSPVHFQNHYLSVPSILSHHQSTTHPHSGRPDAVRPLDDSQTTPVGQSGQDGSFFFKKGDKWGQHRGNKGQYRAPILGPR